MHRNDRAASNNTFKKPDSTGTGSVLSKKGPAFFLDFTLVLYPAPLIAQGAVIRSQPHRKYGTTEAMLLNGIKSTA